MALLDAPPARVAVAAGPAVRRRIGADVAAVAVYTALGAVVMAGFLPDVNGRISSHLPIDQTWFEWLLAHGAYSVRHLSNPLFSLRQNAPAGVNMMANTSVLGITIPLAPITMWLGAKAAYVIWMIGALAATASTTYWALSRHVVRSRAAAFVGGALGGFAPGVVHHGNGQPNFVTNFVLPIIVVRVLRLGAGGRWVRDGVVLGVLVTCQVFINEELLLITAVACGVIVLIRATAAGPLLRGLGVTALTAGALCAYPLWVQLAGPQSFHALPAFHSWGEDPFAYLTLPRDSLGGDASAESTIGRIEQNTWFGWPLTTLVVLVSVVLWRRSFIVRTSVAVAGLFAVLSLGPRIRFDGYLTTLPGPWSAVPGDLPILGLVMPSRLSYAVTGAFVVILAVGWDRLGRPRFAPAPLFWHAATVAALVPLIPMPLPSTREEPVPQFITSQAWRQFVPAGRTLIPVPLPSNGDGLAALGWSARALLEFPVPEGYFLGPDRNGEGHFGPVERSYTSRIVSDTLRSGVAPPVTAAMRAAVLGDIRRWHGSVVVLTATAAHAPLRTLWQRILGPAQRRQDVWLWRIGCSRSVDPMYRSSLYC